jgi:KipI family sensor histidine kinase inhibitor
LPPLFFPCRRFGTRYGLIGEADCIMRGTFGASGDIIIYPRFLPVGDSALSVELGDVIDAGINALVRALDRAIAAANIPGIIETVPSFRALMVIYEPEEIDPDTLIADLKRLIAGGLNAHAANARSWTVPVAYGVPVDDDLREVAAATGLSCDEVVAMHSGADYQVYVIGFVPGLPVLGGLPRAFAPVATPGASARYSRRQRDDRRHARIDRTDDDAEWLVHARPNAAASVQSW